MNYYRVKNWDAFQHYKDRNPPWIRLYNSLLVDADFLCLQDASKLHLIMIWLLASKTGNRIPDNPDLLSKLLVVSTPVDITPIVNAGFLIPYESDSNALAECLQLAIPETETETETEREKEKDFVEKVSTADDLEIKTNTIWEKWPSSRRATKKVVRKELKSALKRESWENILAGVESYALSPLVTSMIEMEKQGFIPLLSTWLHQDRWTADKKSYSEPCSEWKARHRQPASRSPCKALESPETKAMYELKETQLPGWDQ